MATHTGYLSAGEVMTDAAQAAGDPSLNIVGRGVYLALLRRALSKMCLEIPIDKRYYDAVIPANGIFQLPKWMAGMNNVWVYNGDQCDPETASNAYEKENFTFEEGENWPSNGLSYNMQNGTSDAMQANSGIDGFWMTTESQYLYYYGIHKGKMMLSSSCRQFSRIRIDYNGLGFQDYCGEEDLLVPFWASEAITDFITMKAIEQRQYEEGKTQLFRSILVDKTVEMKAFDGTWSKAKMYWGQMDNKERKDTVMYISKMGHAFETF